MSTKVNGYDVVIVRGTPRFRLNNKLIKRELVPLDVQDELLAIASDKDAVRTVGAAPDPHTFTTEQPTNEPVELNDEVGDNPYLAEPTELTTSPNAPFSDMELQLLEENQELKRQLVELAPSKNQQTIRDLGVELLESFGVYTALAGRDPQIGDVHPFTLKPMNRYDVGLAYAERKKSVHVAVDTLTPHQESAPQANPEGNGGFASFADRTGVSFQTQSSMRMQNHGNDPINEEATAEPNLRGTTIRPYW